jgi:hypothetical protein
MLSTRRRRNGQSVSRLVPDQRSNELAGAEEAEAEAVTEVVVAVADEVTVVEEDAVAGAGDEFP